MEKGNTNNPKGRPAGTPNRITTDLREFLKLLLTDNLEQFKTDFEHLEPKDRLIMMERFLGYILPKLSGITIKEQVVDEKKLKTREEFLARLNRVANSNN